MSPLIWVIPSVVVATIVLYSWYLRASGPSREQREAEEFERARKAFHRERERAEAKFFELAASSGRPRGLRWKDCEFEDGVAYARAHGDVAIIEPGVGAPADSTGESAHVVA